MDYYSSGDDDAVADDDLDLRGCWRPLASCRNDTSSLVVFLGSTAASSSFKSNSIVGLCYLKRYKRS